MDQGNDYLIQVKGNNKLLLNRIKQVEANSTAVDTWQEVEKKRGRKEKRTYRVYTLHQQDDNGNKVKNLKQFVVFESEGTRKEHEYKEKHYYITSRSEPDAKYLGLKIREHWALESYHWVRDVILNEDNSQIKEKKRAKNIAVLRTIIFNLIKIKTGKSIKYGIEKCQTKIEVSIELIST